MVVEQRRNSMCVANLDSGNHKRSKRWSLVVEIDMINRTTRCNRSLRNLLQFESFDELFVVLNEREILLVTIGEHRLLDFG